MAVHTLGIKESDSEAISDDVSKTGYLANHPMTYCLWNQASLKIMRSPDAEQVYIWSACLFFLYSGPNGSEVLQNGTVGCKG